MTEREACIGFSLMRGIGPLRFKLLSDYFGSALAAWQASEEKLRATGLGNKLTSAFIAFRQEFSAANFFEALARKQITLITRVDEDYPQPLAQIPDPPLVLYIKGSLPQKFERMLGVVGTRKPTSYGREITVKLVSELVGSGIIVVSGLARGIDSVAHRTTLGNGGVTIAVLGCGVDIVYPPEHKSLYTEIIEKGGAIISEVPPGQLVARGLFPARNRIISGLARGVLVTEGAEDSGSLITARLAAEQGRDVFAVPGPINSYLSAGPVKLLKQGAKLVTSAADILEELDLPVHTQSNKISHQDLSLEAQKILAALENGIATFDAIVVETQLQTTEVSSMLTMMELQGILKSTGDGKYALL